MIDIAGAEGFLVCVLVDKTALLVDPTEQAHLFTIPPIGSLKIAVLDFGIDYVLLRHHELPRNGSNCEAAHVLKTLKDSPICVLSPPYFHRTIYLLFKYILINFNI